ncbi:MAG: hypothetical protein HY906_19455 [Deltaproteobacteria bacterium]|nr:hypothetical protein [Deltaproteobacteria bacterium]
MTRATMLSTAGPVLPVGLAGTWDDARICCPSAVRRDDGQVVLWYAGQSKGEERATWSIGLATSMDGLAFTKHAANPVLGEGQLEEFDGRGVSEPEVAWDQRSQMYRMWYTAHAFLGDQSLGHAASSDGVSWQKYPQNPVVTQDLVGLELIGSPAVLADEGELRMSIHGRQPGSRKLSIDEVRNLGQEVVAAP